MRNNDPKEKVIDLPGETWYTVPFAIGYYMASNLLRIKSLDQKIIQKSKRWPNGHPIVQRGIIMRQYVGSQGYMLCSLHIGKKRIERKVHRIVARTFLPNPENLHDVNHIDGNKLNNCIENLEWCTHKHNIQHMIITGLRKYATGVNHGCCKLSREQIFEIYHSNNSTALLVEKFGISASSVRQIKTGYRHNDVTGHAKKIQKRRPQFNPHYE